MQTGQARQEPPLRVLFMSMASAKIRGQRQCATRKQPPPLKLWPELSIVTVASSHAFASALQLERKLQAHQATQTIPN